MEENNHTFTKIDNNNVKMVFTKSKQEQSGVFNSKATYYIGKESFPILNPRMGKIGVGDIFMERITVIGSAPEFINMSIGSHNLNVKVKPNGVVEFGPIPIVLDCYSNILLDLNYNYEIEFSNRGFGFYKFINEYQLKRVVSKDALIYCHKTKKCNIDDVEEEMWIKADLIVESGMIMWEPFIN